MGSLRHDVFISYCRSDANFARSVEKNVRQAGFTTWRDLDPDAADEWRDESDNGIKGANAVIVILSPHSAHSLDVTYEWSFALGLGVPLLPIRYNAPWSELHPRLNALQTLDFSDGLPPAWEQLLDKLRELAAARREHTMTVPRDAPHVVQMAAAALDSMYEEERQAALQSLDEMNDPSAVALLAEAILHPIEQVRFEAGVALGKHHDPRAVAPILEAARAGREIEIETLTRIGRSAIPALHEAVRSNHPAERGTAMVALGWIGGPTAIEILTECLSSKDADIRRDAAGALWTTRDLAALPALRTAITDSDAKVRQKIARALGACGGAATAQDLVLLLSDSDREVRGAACWALDQAPAPAAVPALLQALEDEYDQVAVHAAEALKKIGDPSVLRALLHGAVHHHDENARTFLRRAIEGFGAAAGPALRAASDDREDAMRAAAMSLLSDCRDPVDLPLFTSKLRDPYAKVRYYAARGLGRKLASEAWPQLLEAADDPDPEVREQAISGLSESGNLTVMPRLIEGLRDDDVHVARRAANGLGDFEDVRAVPELIECLFDDGVAETASWALEKIGTKQARIAVRAWKRRTKDERASAV